MGLRSLGNKIASFSDVFSNTGTDASSLAPRPTFTASGGNVDGISPGNGWTYHTFTSPGTFTLSDAILGSTKSLEILLIAGGGGGGVANDNGSDGGGGAGAGNVNTYTGFTVSDLSDGDYNITVGNGGTGVTGGSSPGSNAIASQVGQDTTFVQVGPNLELRAKGGGGGGSGPIGGPLGPYGTGGSGGGGGGGGGAADPHYGPGITNTAQPLLSGGGGTITQRGNIGARGNNPPYYGGGGGGAGSAGNPGTPGDGNNGGGRGGDAVLLSDFTGPLIGVPALAPMNGYYGGGGPGGSGGPGDHPGVQAPIGGAGNTQGSPASNGPRQGNNGFANTGAGGSANSGAPSSGPPSPGGNGGPGIVVVRYQV